MLYLSVTLRQPLAIKLKRHIADSSELHNIHCTFKHSAYYSSKVFISRDVNSYSLRGKSTPEEYTPSIYTWPSNTDLDTKCLSR